MKTIPPLTGRSVPELLQASAVLLVLGFFLWSLRDSLTPFLLFWVLLAALLPFRGTLAFRAIAIIAGALTVIWLLQEAGGVLAPFVLALLLAYVLNPVVAVLSRGRLSRTGALLLLLVPVAGALALIVTVALPAVADQLQDLVARLPQMVERLAVWTEGVGERLRGVAIPGMEGILALDAADLVALAQDRWEAIVRWAWGGFLGVGRGVGALLSLLGFVFLTPVLTFYLLRDWDRLKARSEELLPRRQRAEVLSFLQEYDQGVAAYLRGQLVVSLTVGALTAGGLWLAQFPYALFLGVVVAIFNVVPYLGLVLSLIPALLIAAVTPPVGLSLLKVAIVYSVAQSLESAVISPRIVGDSTGLNPVWVVLALAVGGFFFGFVGLLLAVPGAVGVKLLLARAVRGYHRSDFYGAEQS